MSTFAGKDCVATRTKSAEVEPNPLALFVLPGPNLLALLVPRDQIRGQTDFTVTPAVQNHQGAPFSGHT